MKNRYVNKVFVFISVMQRVSFALILAGVVTACGNKTEYVSPAIKPLIEAVYASGLVVSVNEYQAFSQVDGYVAEKLVHDGDAVKRGDPLYSIQADQQNARYRIAKENYELAQRNLQDDSPVLNELKAALTNAHTKMQFDSTNHARYSNLIKNNATSQAEYDRVKLIYENSRNDYLLAKSRYTRTYDQLYLDYKNAENQYRIARDESDRYVIRSLVDGKVYKTLKETGELIKRTEMIAVLGSASAFYLQLNVDELDIRRIQVGQSAVVKIDAYPDQAFHAAISRIYPLVDSRQQAFRVDARLTEPLPGAFSGLALEANIIIRENKQALVIPKNALLPGDTIILGTESGDRKVKIRKGIHTLDEIEVLEGITENSRIKVMHQ